MFDLNHAINAWRDQLANAKTCTRNDLAELEEHLREDIAHLTATPDPLTQEEAFLVATHRLGQPDSLTREYAKLNPLRQRVFSTARGLLAYSLLALLVSSLASFTGLIMRMIAGNNAYVQPSDRERLFELYYVVRVLFLLGGLTLAWVVVRSSIAQRIIRSTRNRLAAWAIAFGIALGASLCIPRLADYLTSSFFSKLLNMHGHAIWVSQADAMTIAFFFLLIVLAWHWRPTACRRRIAN